MMDERKRDLVLQVAWLELERFIVDWMPNPHRWWYEADVSAEIANRIYHALGPTFSVVPVDDLQDETPCKCGQASRIHLNFPVYEEGVPKYPRPDIAIVDDDPDAPYLWVCEVKIGSTSRSSDDEAKVKRWLQRVPPLVLYGCTLDLKALKKDAPPWRGPIVEGHYRRYAVQAYHPSVMSG
jgi:hypothetical protein